MNADIRLQGQGDDLLMTGAPAGEADFHLDDSTRDVRRVKRLTQLGVYAGVFAAQPAFYLLFGFSPVQLAAVVGVSLTIATVAIQGAFSEMYRLRKRGAYPGAIAIHLGSLATFDAACQAMAVIIEQLLHVQGSFLALLSDDGYLSLVAASKVGRVDADRYLRLGASCVERAMNDGKPVAFNARSDLLAEAVLAPDQQLVFIPVQSFQRVMGVLGVVAADSNVELDDHEMLTSLGTAIGVSLDSLRQRDGLRTLAAIDELTKVYNRRYFFDQLEREIAAARRYASELSILIFDLDGLKRLNDEFGHAVGDEALRTLAQRLVRYSRASDIVARLGGDEFAVILPRTGAEGAAEIAQRLQSSVEGEPLNGAAPREVRLEVSGGFASFPAQADDAEMLLREADGRMYAAKAARRRRTHS